jgi:hypothetical protein
MYTEQETIDALLDLLPIVADREWEVSDNGEIRTRVWKNTPGCCPLCALANEVQGRAEWFIMADSAVASCIEPYGNGGAIDRLMYAADSTTREPALRYRMMLALGLTPDVEAPTDAPA